MTEQLRSELEQSLMDDGIYGARLIVASLMPIIETHFAERERAIEKRLMDLWEKGAVEIYDARLTGKTEP